MKKAPQRSGHILTSLTKSIKNGDMPLQDKGTTKERPHTDITYSKSIKNGDMPLQEAEQASTRAFCISETIQYNGVYNGW